MSWSDFDYRDTAEYRQMSDDYAERAEEARWRREMADPVWYSPTSEPGAYYRPVYDSEGTADTSRKPPTSASAAAEARLQIIQLTLNFDERAA